jgi:hypothetical protein
VVIISFNRLAFVAPHQRTVPLTQGGVSDGRKRLNGSELCPAILTVT